MTRCNSFLLITKLDGARRQLETASRLFFAHGDPVSIHTLTTAAYNVLHDLLEHHFGEKTLIKGNLLDSIEPSARASVRKLANAPENFLKHANKDPETVLEFSSDHTEILLWEGCVIYERLTGECPAYIHAFWSWRMSGHIDVLAQGTNPALLAALKAMQRYRFDRAKYLKVTLEACASRGSRNFNAF